MSLSSKSGSTWQPLMVGRDRELGQIKAILERRNPALVVMAGETGMGKTSLLREARLLASRLGWNTVPDVNQQEMTVEPETTEDTFSSRVRELLKIPAPEIFPEAAPDLEVRKVLQYGLIQPTQAMVSKAIATSGLSPAWKGVLNRATHAAGQILQAFPFEQASSEKKAEESRRLPPSRHPLFHPLVEQLRHRAPVLLLIDGYRPEASFTGWFTRHFVTEIKKTEAPVVIIVADRPGNVAMLLPFADESISIGPLDPESLRQLLENIGQQLSPPLGEDELHTYLKEVCEKPEILGSLTRVLALARPAEQ